MKLYQFLYCECVFESSYATMSIHKTKKGAWKAMNKWLNERFQKRYDERLRYGKRGEWGAWKVGIHENWTVGEKEILD